MVGKRTDKCLNPEKYKDVEEKDPARHRPFFQRLFGMFTGEKWMDFTQE